MTEMSSATFEVEMHAFASGAIREVAVPGDVATRIWQIHEDDKRRAEMLEAVFLYGQNDAFEILGLPMAELPPQSLPSVSMGDVVRLDGKRFRCEDVGWKEI